MNKILTSNLIDLTIRFIAITVATIKMNEASKNNCNTFLENMKCFIIEQMKVIVVLRTIQLIIYTIITITM